MEIEQAIKKINSFKDNALTGTLSDIEIGFRGATRSDTEHLCKKFSLDSDLISSALELKKASSQINVVIHAVGILLALPRILDDN